MAAQENHAEVVKYLMDHGANQNLTTEDGFTPLSIALRQGHYQTAVILMENDSGNKMRLPAMHIAAKNDDVQAAKLLLQNSRSSCQIIKSGFTPLHLAAHYGSLLVSKILIENEVEIDWQAKNGITSLHVASKWGNANIVSLLLDNNAKINCITKDLLTPLHCASRNGHDAVVSILCRRDALVSSKTKNGLTALHMAAQGDHFECANILLFYKAPINEITADYLTPLHIAAHYGNTKVAKILLRDKCDINARAKNGFTALHVACKKNRMKIVELLLLNEAAVESKTENGLTPLLVASFMGHHHIVLHLLKNGADTNASTEQGETALHLAARSNKNDVLRILCENGADVDAKAKEGQTALHILSRIGNHEGVLLLLQNGASIESTTNNLYRPLHIAVKEGNISTVTRLMDVGADQFVTTKTGNTALHIAARYGISPIVRLLCDRGAILDAQNKHGLTPLHVAVHYNRADVAKFLAEKGANLQAKSLNGYTPMHIAAKMNLLECNKILCEIGADINSESKDGLTPLHLAAYEGNKEIVQLLLKFKALSSCKSYNEDLTPMHVVAQKGNVAIAEILAKHGSEIDPITKTGFTPLHIASYFGHVNMVRFFIEHSASINAVTKTGWTALSIAMQMGFAPITHFLKKRSAKINSMSSKYVILPPENIEKMILDSEFGSPHQKSARSNKNTRNFSVKGNSPVEESMSGFDDLDYLNDKFFHDTLPNKKKENNKENINDEYKKSMAILTNSKKSYDEQSYNVQQNRGNMSLSHQRPDKVKNKIELTKYVNKEAGLLIRNVQNNYNWANRFTPAMFSVNNRQLLIKQSAANKFIDKKPVSSRFLTSFLVDARGAVMSGCRHSGIRIIFPPTNVCSPLQITCKFLKEMNFARLPVVEGEDLAARIIELRPAGISFSGPIVLEVPYFTSTKDTGREITILKSEDGNIWQEHVASIAEKEAKTLLNKTFEDAKVQDTVFNGQTVRIFTQTFPHYYAIISRIHTDRKSVSPLGDVISSTILPGIQLLLPPSFVTLPEFVSMQVFAVSKETTDRMTDVVGLTGDASTNLLIAIDSEQHEFKKAANIHIPITSIEEIGHINLIHDLKLYCRFRGGDLTSDSWRNITEKSLLATTNGILSFQTEKPARFFVTGSKNEEQAIHLAEFLHRRFTKVLYRVKITIFARRFNSVKATLRIFCLTDDRINDAMNFNQFYIEIGRSKIIEMYEDSSVLINVNGNLKPVVKSSKHLTLVFKPFSKNHLLVPIEVNNPQSNPSGVVTASFDRDYEDCSLEIELPKQCFPLMDFERVVKRKHFQNMSAPTDRANRSVKETLRITDIADAIQNDWVLLARKLDFAQDEIINIQKNYRYASEKAFVLLNMWIKRENYGSRGNELELALRLINRDDVIHKYMS